MRQLLLATLVAVTLGLGGCLNFNQPSDSKIKTMSTDYFNQQFAGLFQLTDVTKNNGYKQSDTHYVAKVTLSAKAERSLEDYAKTRMQDADLSPLEKMSNSMAIGILKMTLPEFAAGDELTFKRNYLFIKTDNGWLLQKELQDDTLNEPTL